MTELNCQAYCSLLLALHEFFSNLILPRNTFVLEKYLQTTPRDQAADEQYQFTRRTSASALLLLPFQNPLHIWPRVATGAPFSASLIPFPCCVIRESSFRQKKRDH
jgi:hypothetical protein